MHGLHTRTAQLRLHNGFAQHSGLVSIQTTHTSTSIQQIRRKQQFSRPTPQTRFNLALTIRGSAYIATTFSQTVPVHRNIIYIVESYVVFGVDYNKPDIDRAKEIEWSAVCVCVYVMFNAHT